MATSAKNKLEFEGKVMASNNCGDFEIVEYITTNDVIIRFISTGTITQASLGNIKKGTVKDLFYPSVYGKGYFGSGPYTSRLNGGLQSTCYKRWKEMIGRCYNIGTTEYTNYGGQGVTVCDEWLNYQNYANWWELNCPNDTYALDKDILYKGNKLYSPDKCCFVTPDINAIFTLRKSQRGEYPLGVRMREGKLIAQINHMGKKIHLGTFNTIEDAFAAYKVAKDRSIKEYADLHKHEITPEVYKALYNYKVEITD